MNRRALGVSFGFAIFAIFAIFALEACSETEQRVYLPLPPHQGAHSVIFGLERGSELTMLAADLQTDMRVLEQSFADLDVLPVQALLYDKTLAGLALAPGLLAIDGTAPVIDTPDAVYTTEVRDGDAGAWSKLDRPSQAVAEYRAKRIEVDRCPGTYQTIRKVELPTGADLSFLLRIADERALIGLLDGTTVILERGAVVHELASRPAGLPIGAAFIDADGDMYFGGGGGELWRGRLIETGTVARIEATPFASSGTDGVFRYMSGGNVAGGYEMFVLDNQGRFMRLYGSQWTELYDFGKIENVGTKGGLARLGPGHAVAASNARAEIVRYREGAAMVDNPEGLASGITGVGRTHDGVVVSTADGYMSESSGPGVWAPLGQSGINVDVYTFVEIQSGFMFGGALGWLGERSGARFCDSDLIGSASIRAIIPFGDQYLIGEDKPRASAFTSVTLIQRLP